MAYIKHREYYAIPFCDGYAPETEVELTCDCCGGDPDYYMDYDGKVTSMDNVIVDEDYSGTILCRDCLIEAIRNGEAECDDDIPELEDFYAEQEAKEQAEKAQASPAVDPVFARIFTEWGVNHD